MKNEIEIVNGLPTDPQTKEFGSLIYPNSIYPVIKNIGPEKLSDRNYLEKRKDYYLGVKYNKNFAVDSLDIDPRKPEYLFNIVIGHLYDNINNCQIQRHRPIRYIFPKQIKNNNNKSVHNTDPNINLSTNIGSKIVISHYDACIDTDVYVFNYLQYLSAYYLDDCKPIVPTDNKIIKQRVKLIYALFLYKLKIMNNLYEYESYDKSRTNYDKYKLRLDYINHYLVAAPIFTCYGLKIPDEIYEIKTETFEDDLLAAHNSSGIGSFYDFLEYSSKLTPDPLYNFRNQWFAGYSTQGKETNAILDEINYYFYQRKIPIPNYIENYKYFHKEEVIESFYTYGDYINSFYKFKKYEENNEKTIGYRYNFLYYNRKYLEADFPSATSSIFYIENQIRKSLSQLSDTDYRFKISEKYYENRRNPKPENEYNRKAIIYYWCLNKMRDKKFKDPNLEHLFTDILNQTQDDPIIPERCR